MPLDNQHRHQNHTETAGKQEMGSMRDNSPPGNQDDNHALAHAKRVADKHQEENREVQQRPEEIGHDPAYQPAQSRKQAQTNHEAQEVEGRSLREESSAQKPEDVAGDQGTERDNGPRDDVPVQSENAEAIYEGTISVIVGKLMEKQGARHTRAITQIGD